MDLAHAPGHGRRFSGGFTVLMAVYGRDDPGRFELAVESVYRNTLRPDDFVLVVDGPAPGDLDRVIRRCAQEHGIRTLRLANNTGLANALNQGLGLVRTQWVARADADDFNLPNRFERQAGALQRVGNELDLLGGAVLEVDEGGSPLGVRAVPLDHHRIAALLERRNPFNHMTVVYRTAMALEAGGYPGIHLREDYGLWASMIAHGARCGNLDEVLVRATAGSGMYRRRGGLRQLRSEWDLQRHLLALGRTRLPSALAFGSIRAAACLLTPRLRGWIYERFLRRSAHAAGADAEARSAGRSRSPVSARRADAADAGPAAPGRAPEHVVVARLIGGLGNQLFQYAAARRIALKNGLSIKLDVLGFAAYKRRPYALAPFRIVQQFATPEEIQRLKRSRLGLLVQRVWPHAEVTHVQERHFHLDPRAREVRSGVYMAGYWQSEKYFHDVADVIRAEFTVDAPPNAENARILRLIQGCNSVAVHVRRGDYITNPRARLLHGGCTLEYYGRALSEILGRVGRPHFFVFSDDPEWARTHLVIRRPVFFVDHNGPAQPHEDLRLLGSCRHHIIANSTFSWWGAWLGAHPDQVVIAPDRWFASGRHDTRDLYPPDWVRI